MNRTLGATLLIAGTAIGAGMLALPITTGIAGFYHALPLIIGCFLYMLASLFLLLEASLYSHSTQNNIMNMAQDHLGPLASYLAWICFLLLLYAVSSAYLSGGGTLIMSLFKTLSPSTHSALPYTLGFGGIIGLIAFLGTRWIDSLNRFFMGGLILSYLFLIYIISPHVNIAHWSGGQSGYLFATIPVVILSFTSHIILPSLRHYLGNNIHALKKACWYGSLIPLLCYLVWEGLVIGLLPQTGSNGLIAVAQSANPLHHLTQALSKQGVFSLTLGNQAFSLFALITSYLGVMLSLIDFLADGFKISSTRLPQRALLTSLCIFPALLMNTFYPSYTLLLSYAGVFVAILYGILPASIVWKARYCTQLPTPRYQFPGGKGCLILMIGLALTVILLQIASTQHWLPQL